MIHCLSVTRGVTVADSPAHIAADFRPPERQPKSRQASRNLGRKQGICNNQDESSASGGQGNEPSKNQEHSEEDDAAVEYKLPLF